MIVMKRRYLIIISVVVFLATCSIVYVNYKKKEIAKQKEQKKKQIKVELDKYSPIKNDVEIISDTVKIDMQTKYVLIGHKVRDTLFCESVVFVLQKELSEEDIVKVNIYNKEDSLVESMTFNKEYIRRIISEPIENSVYFDFRKYILKEMTSQTLYDYDFYLDLSLRAMGYKGKRKDFNEVLLLCSKECINKSEGDNYLKVLVEFKKMLEKHGPKDVQTKHLDYFINYPRCEKLLKVRALSDSLDHVKY